MYIREEDKNPDLYTETYDKWEDWMVGEVVYYVGHSGEEWGVVTEPNEVRRDMLWARWEKNEWKELSIHVSYVKFKKRYTNKDSKVKVLAVKTVSIPTEIEFEGRVYVLKESV